MNQRVAIIGAGFSGLGAAIRLKQQGIGDFVVLERAGAVGGTWRDNSYPGCGCDVPSHLYSFSFALNPEWSHVMAPYHEIRAYLEDCTDRFAIRPHIRFDCTVTGAAWDDDAEVWRIATSDGEVTARVLVSGAGPLAEPSIPKLPGLKTFKGTQFHSARWDQARDLQSGLDGLRPLMRDAARTVAALGPANRRARPLLARAAALFDDLVPLARGASVTLANLHPIAAYVAEHRQRFGSFIGNIADTVDNRDAAGGWLHGFLILDPAGGLARPVPCGDKGGLCSNAYPAPDGPVDEQPYRPGGDPRLRPVMP